MKFENFYQPSTVGAIGEVLDCSKYLIDNKQQFDEGITKGFTIYKQLGEDNKKKNTVGPELSDRQVEIIKKTYNQLKKDLFINQGTELKMNKVFCRHWLQMQ